MHTGFPLILVLFLVSCTGKEPVTTQSTAFSTGRALSQLTDRRLGEVSGLASSFRYPGLFWTHNDSGNPATVYLVDEQLKVKLACRLKGAKNRDWEDIAVGPGPDPDKRYVYVADIGDNAASHAVKYIYRFEEPALDTHGQQVDITLFDTIAFRLEDGRKDTEAIIVHPQTKNIYIVSKREEPVWVYELLYPYQGSQPLTARKVISIPVAQIVAADISADGNEILMKNYDHIFYWRGEGMSFVDMLRQEPITVPYTEEPQGEAIAFRQDDAGFYTLSEMVGRERIFLFYYARNGTAGK